MVITPALRTGLLRGSWALSTRDRGGSPSWNSIQPSPVLRLSLCPLQDKRWQWGNRETLEVRAPTQVSTPGFSWPDSIPTFGNMKWTRSVISGHSKDVPISWSLLMKCSFLFLLLLKHYPFSRFCIKAISSVASPSFPGSELVILSWHSVSLQSAL